MTQARRAVIALISVAAMCGLAHADKINMQEGLWEMTSTMNMGGQKMASPSSQHCITKKDLLPPGAIATPPGMKCQSSQKVTASTVTWSMDCTMDGGATTKIIGKITYTGKKFTGSASLTMNIPGAGGIQKGSMTMAGKYIGACKK